MGLAAEIHAICQATLAERGCGRLLAVRVAVGELSAVEPDLLRFAWEAQVAGSPEEAAELRIEWRPARQYCPACRAEKRGDPGSWVRLCPDCDGFLRVDGGDELDILDLIVAEAAAITGKDEGDGTVH